MDRYDEQAWEIATKFSKFPDGRVVYGPVWAEEMSLSIASALRAAAGVQEGCVMLPGGKVVKVLGNLPMTADGCVVGLGVTLYEPFDDIETGLVVIEVEHLNDADDAKTCYSTREAAEAASKAVPRVIAIDEANPKLPQMEQAMRQVEKEAGNG